MKNQIEKVLRDILASFGADISESELLSAPDKEHGDYSTNIALKAFQLIKNQLPENSYSRVIPVKASDPMSFAQQVGDLISERKDELGLKEVQVVKPGFINFWLSENELIDKVLDNKLQIEPIYSKKKIIVEYTDSNPFKEFHIGHLYSNIVGESIARLLEAVSADVVRACYQGDVGLHVAKAIWGMKTELENDGIDISGFRDGNTLKATAAFLGRSYARGAKMFEEDEKIKEEIIAINKKVYERTDEEINKLYDFGREWSLEYFKSIYKRLGTDFKEFYFESQVSQDGLDIVKAGLVNGIFNEENGAVIFKGEQYGLHTRVFRNSLGLPTYEAKELGLAIKKDREQHPDASIVITGNEINEYFKVLLKVLSLIDPEISKKTKHISHGMVRLPGGKMSSRLGNVLTGEWLLDEAKKRASVKIEEVRKKRDESVERSTTVSDTENPLSELISIGAVKWALLKSSIGKDIEFNFDESVSFEGNSGPYLQYTYVRTQSILEKARGLGEKRVEGFNPEELVLLRQLYKFSDTVVTAASEYSPNTLTTYLYELSQAFNLFYQKHKVIEDGKYITHRLQLVRRVGEVITEGLSLLGIASPEKM